MFTAITPAENELVHSNQGHQQKMDLFTAITSTTHWTIAAENGLVHNYQERKCWGGLPEKSINYHNGNLSPLPTGHLGGINYGDYGCFDILAIICDNYGDVWKVHQTNVATPLRMRGGEGDMEITLYASQQNTSHIAKHTPLQGVTSGTRTSLTRCDKVHAPLQGAPGDTLTPLTRCDKVRLGQVCCGGTLHLGLQSSWSRPRGWK